MSNKITRKLITKNNEYDVARQMRDVRTFGKQFYDFLILPRVKGSLYLLSIPVLVVKPVLWPLLVLMMLVYEFIVLGYKSRLPFHLPEQANQKDYNDHKPGRTGYNKARGIFHVGNEMATNEELYLNFSTLLRHVLCFGTTGAGKTETLVSFAANFISTGAGLIYNDAKAAPKLAWQIYTLARYFGRDDDYLLINYLNGNSSEKRDPAMRLSNDSAPFANGSAESNAQVVISLLPVDSGGSNKVFSEAAIALISAVMPALTELRDLGLIRIDPAVIRDHLEYDRCTKLIGHPLLSTKARRAIMAFISSRGYDSSKPFNKQPEEVKKQFGFAQSYFIRSMSSLSDTYGDIYMTGAGEVDYRDVILNDRILCSLLPSMQYSGEELANLGKIILSSTRNAMAVGLGYEIEGSKEDTLESLPTATNRPSAIINDEYAYMAVEGFAVTAAQGRGLNFCMIFAGQDYAGFKRASEGEAEQIVANCRFKYIMALEDAGSTLELVKQIAGDTYVSMVQGYEDKKGFTGGYKDGLNASISKVDRISAQQLKELGEGEGFAFYQDQMLLVRNFWHGFTDEDLVSDVRLGRRILIDHRPTRGPMAEKLALDSKLIRNDLKVFLDNLEPGDINYDELHPPRALMGAMEAQASIDTSILSPTEKGLHLAGLLFEGITLETLNEENDLDEAEGTESLLSGLSGNFDNDEEELIGAYSNDDLAEEDAVQQALDSVSSFFNSMVITEVDYEAKPLTQESAKEFIKEEDQSNQSTESQGNHLTFNSMLGISDKDDGLISNDQEYVIAKGVARIEKALGKTDDEARTAARDTLSAVRDATQFPTDPKPSRDDVDANDLVNTVRKLLMDSKKGNE